MTPAELLEVFHRRIRLPDADAIPGWKQEHDGLVHRSYDDGPDGAGFIETPRGLGDDPDAVIADQVAFFRDRGLPFEWKTSRTTSRPTSASAWSGPGSAGRSRRR